MTTPCVHRGEQIGWATCPGCQWRVELKVFCCTVHGGCTVGKQAKDTTCCRGCEDYEPQGDGERGRQGGGGGELRT